jgi:hypothetical protein
MTPPSAKKIREHLSRVVAKLVDERRIQLSDEVEDGLYTVYILEMSREVWECNKCRKSLGDEWLGARAFYVGMTNKTREERLAEHVTSNLETQNGVDVTERTGTPYTRGAKMTRDHGFEPAEEIEPLAPDGYLLDGRLISNHAKLLEQIVIPTALRTLGFAAYAGAPEQFVVPPKTRT